MDNVNFDQLSPEEKAKLRTQLEAEEKAEKNRVKRERDTYEQIKNAQVLTTFKQLQGISSNLEIAKAKVFENFQAILKMKQELFNLTEEKMLTQESHTFTTTDGAISVMIGHNVIDNWDETVSVGIEGVNQWLKKQVTDEKSAMLVSVIRDLMKPNKDGALKANRILDLSKKAAEFGDKELIGYVEQIRDAYRPSKTGTFVKARYVDEHGQKQWLALSMSAV